MFKQAITLSLKVSHLAIPLAVRHRITVCHCLLIHITCLYAMLSALCVSGFYLFFTFHCIRPRAPSVFMKWQQKKTLHTKLKYKNLSINIKFCISPSNLMPWCLVFFFFFAGNLSVDLVIFVCLSSLLGCHCPSFALRLWSSVLWCPCSCLLQGRWQAGENKREKDAGKQAPSMHKRWTRQVQEAGSDFALPWNFRIVDAAGRGAVCDAIFFLVVRWRGWTG